VDQQADVIQMIVIQVDQAVDVIQMIDPHLPDREVAGLDLNTVSFCDFPAPNNQSLHPNLD
jgi:hypothetical protein